MDWTYAIERNRDALKRVLLALVAMAELAGADLSFSPFTGRRWLREAESDEGQLHARPTLPRHLHRAVLRLLRPAEAAARRLVIMAARGLVVTSPPSRPRKPKPPLTRTWKGGRPGLVTGIWMPPHLRPEAGRPPRRAEKCALPLFDPLPRLGGRKRKAASGLPRICTPGWSQPFPAPPERQSNGRRVLAPDDAIDALRLALRLRALGAALDDLPREAKRFARWRMRLDAKGAETGSRDAAGASGTRSSRPDRFRRLWPLRPGRPPSVGRRAGLASRPVHAVHDILSDTHALALRALERFDSS